MIPFSTKLKSGQTFLGICISPDDIRKLAEGNELVIDLASADIGLWTRNPDSSRNFIQPRESKVVLIPGDSRDDIGSFLRVKLPEL